jgi:hypothetical protein
MAQPTKLAAPYGANVAGNKNTPLPIMLPTTSAVAIHNPSGFAGAPLALVTSVMQCSFA